MRNCRKGKVILDLVLAGTAGRSTSLDDSNWSCGLQCAWIHSPGNSCQCQVHHKTVFGEDVPRPPTCTTPLQPSPPRPKDKKFLLNQTLALALLQQHLLVAILAIHFKSRTSAHIINSRQKLQCRIHDIDVELTKQRKFLELEQKLSQLCGNNKVSNKAAASTIPKDIEEVLSCHKQDREMPGKGSNKYASTNAI